MTPNLPSDSTIIVVKKLLFQNEKQQKEKEGYTIQERERKKKTDNITNRQKSNETK